MEIPVEARETVLAKGVDAAFGEYLFGYVKDDYRMPDPADAINVTAKWTNKPTDASKLDELTHWWQQVGTDAFDMEEGLLRFETYRVIGPRSLPGHQGPHVPPHQGYRRAVQEGH
jgi:hypothetical protein